MPGVRRRSKFVLVRRNRPEMADFGPSLVKHRLTMGHSSPDLQVVAIISVEIPPKLAGALPVGITNQ